MKVEVRLPEDFEIDVRITIEGDITDGIPEEKRADIENRLRDLFECFASLVIPPVRSRTYLNDWPPVALQLRKLLGRQFRVSFGRWVANRMVE